MKILAALLVLLAITAAAETIEVNPPKTVCATVSRVVLEGGAQYDTTTRNWQVVVNIEIAPPVLPAVDGVEMDPMPTMTRRVVVTVKRAEIEALAKKSSLTEDELSASVRGVIMGKLQTLLAGMGAQ